MQVDPGSVTIRGFAMLFHLRCYDRPDSLHIRKANRQGHLAYLDALGDRVAFAGPTVAEDGETMNGSVLVIDFRDRDAAEAWAAEDPYHKAGLFERVEITATRQVLPRR